MIPVRWPEPFGLVMTEAIACGTPVIALPEGSAPELVRDGETGFLVADEREMAAAVGAPRPNRSRALPQERRGAIRRRTLAAAQERAYEKVRARYSASRRGASDMATL
jgi:glycosyltransferase involved in cell wall biosynthesis